MGALPFHRLFPDLGLIVLLYAALEDGPDTGLRAGLWLGMLLDFMGLERFGTYTVLYACLGGVAGLLRGNVFTEAFISQSLIPAVAYLAVLGAQYTLIKQDEVGAQTFEFWQALKGSAFWTTVLTAPLVFSLSSRLLHKKRIPQRNVYIP